MKFFLVWKESGRHSSQRKDLTVVSSTTNFANRINNILTLMLIASMFAIPIYITIADPLLSAMQYYHVTLSVGDVLVSFVILMGMGLLTIAVTVQQHLAKCTKMNIYVLLVVNQHVKHRRCSIGDIFARKKG